MGNDVVRPSTAGADAWDAAYKESVIQPAWEQAGHLIGSIGARYTTAALGLKDGRTVRGWVDGRSEPRENDVARRLTVLYRVVRALETVYTPAMAAVFLRSANPQLGDRAPLVMLATRSVDEAERDVLGAAQAFLEG